MYTGKNQIQIQRYLRKKWKHTRKLDSVQINARDVTALMLVKCIGYVLITGTPVSLPGQSAAENQQ